MVAKGWVTLQGVAEWQYQKEEAERVVRSLNSVKAVVNEIELKPRVSALGAKMKTRLEQKAMAPSTCDIPLATQAGVWAPLPVSFGENLSQNLPCLYQG